MQNDDNALPSTILAAVVFLIKNAYNSLLARHHVVENVQAKIS